MSEDLEYNSIDSANLTAKEDRRSPVRPALWASGPSQK